MDAQIQSLAEATVLDLDGHAHKLGTHFDDHPAVLLFVRHFG
jgi:hypothetical protein